MLFSTKLFIFVNIFYENKYIHIDDYSRTIFIEYAFKSHEHNWFQVIDIIKLETVSQLVLKTLNMVFNI